MDSAKCPHCGYEYPDPSVSLHCPNCDKPIDDITKILRRRTQSRIVKNLLPWIVLIAINVPAIIGISRMDTLSGGAVIIGAIPGLLKSAYIIILVVFDLIYLGVWVYRARRK